jgi:hypothetical protein
MAVSQEERFAETGKPYPTAAPAASHRLVKGLLDIAMS